MYYVGRCGAVPPGLWYPLVRFACLTTLFARDYSPSSQVGLGGFVFYNSLIIKWF